MKIHVIIPTIAEKIQWLTRTICILRLQERIDLKITVLVDKKPWDQPALPPEFDSLHVNIVETPSSDRIKRQHQIVNQTILSMDPDEMICVMDDDYWCPSTQSLSRLIEAWKPGSIVVPGMLGNTTTRIDQPTNPIRVEDGSICSEDMSHYSVKSYEDAYCMHPMCGNPKIMSVRTWNDLGGFPSGYYHYWFADTELYFRAMDILIRVPDLYFVHIDHERNFEEMFSRHNALVFMKRIGHRLPVDSPYRKFAESKVA